MTLTAVGTNVIYGERHDSVVTLPITDSTTITAGDFVELTSGKLIKSVTTLSTSLQGVAKTTETMDVLSTSGMQKYCGIITEGLIKVKGLVEGSGGTYTTALAVGDKVSFHYSATAGYGQFVVNSASAPCGTVVYGSVASSGTTADQWDYVLIELDFESPGGGGADIPSVIQKTVTSSSAYKHQFRDTATYVYSSSANVLDIVGPTTNISGSTSIKLNGPITFDDDGTLTDASNIMTVTQNTITLAGATKINLDGPTDVSGILTVDTTGSPADGIKINATTPADALEISSASSANAINISGNQSATAINVAGTAVTGLLVAGATTTGISITGNATDGIKIQTGTVTDAIEIAGTTTNAINVSASCSGSALVTAATLASQTLENKNLSLTYTTDSTFITGTDITYSSARGSSNIYLNSTWTGASGGFSNIYSLVTASTNWTGATDGVVGIKSVVLSSGVAITDGSLISGQFIAKKAGANDAAAEVAVVGLEGWFMETGSGEVRTGIGGSFGWHADSSDAAHTAGSVWRGIQVFCDSAGTTNAEETTALYLWGQTGTTINGLIVGAGTWTNGIRLVGGATTTTGIKFGGTAIGGASNLTVTTGIDLQEVTGCTNAIITGGTGGSASARVLKGVMTVNNANYGDGYALCESELTMTGTVTGAVSALSSWINMATVTTGANYVCAQSNGLWSDTGGVLTNGIFIFGMRAQCLLQTNGGVGGATFYPFSIVNNTNVTTAMILCNDATSDLGETTISEGAATYVPLFSDNEGLRYVKVFKAA